MILSIDFVIGLLWGMSASIVVLSFLAVRGPPLRSKAKTQESPKASGSVCEIHGSIPNKKCPRCQELRA